MVAKLYYKNKLMIRLIKPFENKRLFTALKLNILTIKDYKLWPDKLIALDAFCQTGLQWTRVFSDEAEYLEMWDIQPEAIVYAKKEFPKAVVKCGDSIDAIMNCKFGRKDFNFVLIDSPIPYKYPDGTFEHFRFFENIFKNIADHAVIMMDVVSNIKTMLDKHPHDENFTKQWIKARNDFYNVKNGAEILPLQMTEIYKQKVITLGYEPKLVTYNSRNQYFGIITIVVSKK
jgi:hypothetical protein